MKHSGLLLMIIIEEERIRCHRVYGEAGRCICPPGTLAVWELTRGENKDISYLCEACKQYSMKKYNETQFTLLC